MLPIVALLAFSNLNVRDIDGVSRSVPAPDAKATVLLFLGVDCPIANRMAPEIARISKDYGKRQVAMFMVYPETTLKATEVRKHLRSFGIAGTAIVDGKHALVKAYKPSVTPQAIVVDPSGKVQYSGRINDLYEEHGKIKPKPTRNDLRVALDEMLAGKRVSVPVTQTVGCFIGD